MSDEDRDYSYETGPFCQHYVSDGDCDEMCVCGHPCRNHSHGDTSECLIDECDCEQFRDRGNG